MELISSQLKYLWFGPECRNAFPSLMFWIKGIITVITILKQKLQFVQWLPDAKPHNAKAGVLLSNMEAMGCGEFNLSNPITAEIGLGYLCGRAGEWRKWQIYQTQPYLPLFVLSGEVLKSSNGSDN